MVQKEIRKHFNLGRGDLKLIFTHGKGFGKVLYKESGLKKMIHHLESQNSVEDTEENYNQKLKDQDFLFEKMKSYFDTNQIIVGKNKLTVRVSKEDPKPVENNDPKVYQPKTIDIRDVVTPLWNLPYSEQIQFKKEKLDSFLKKKDLPVSQDIVEHQFKENNLERNSFEFTFGFDDKSEPCIGFKGCSFMSDKNLVYDTKNVDFISPSLRKRIEYIQDGLLKEKNRDLIYNRETETGYLKHIKIKMNTKNEMAALVNLYLKEESITKDKLDTLVLEKKKYLEKHDFQSIFRSDGSDIFFFMSFFLFDSIQISFNTDTFDGFASNYVFQLQGDGFVEQEIGNYTFRLSPLGFFQCNIFIFNQIIEKISKNYDRKNKTLLDLCCGQMSIGILLSSFFQTVIGVENNEQSIEDFYKNQQVNEISNCKIVNADVNTISIDKLMKGEQTDLECIPNEDVKIDQETGIAPEENTSDLQDESNIVNRYPKRDTCTAILDPPRPGVQKKLIKRIRKIKHITELFYISCDYGQSIQNIQDLIRKQSNAYSEPFNLVNIWCFDMFVGTKNIEVLYHFKR